MIGSVFKQLLRPLCYLSIRGDAKIHIDLTLPLTGAACSCLILNLIGARALGAGGLVEGLNELLQVLVGFYVASLAAVSAFGSVALDQDVRGTSLAKKSVTRRQLLAYLFGYLALISLVLYVLGVFANLAAPAISKLAADSLVAQSLLAIYLFVWWNMVSVTLLGLYYLVDRAYRPDPIVSKECNDEDAVSTSSE